MSLSVHNDIVNRYGHVINETSCIHCMLEVIKSTSVLTSVINNEKNFHNIPAESTRVCSRVQSSLTSHPRHKVIVNEVTTCAGSVEFGLYSDIRRTVTDIFKHTYDNCHKIAL